MQKKNMAKHSAKNVAENTAKDAVVRYPRAILHFDGDSFFASVEQALDYRLRGKPVITGVERGAVTSLSYEAKSFGLYRGMSMREIKIRCPQAIFVSSDYAAYAIFAHRMYSIVRSFAPIVEEYSIDECFADITELVDRRELVGAGEQGRSLGGSYEEIALRIKAELEESLGITFGVGLAPTKTLAKAASKAHKPAGFTPVPMDEREQFLSSLSVHAVWGLGGASGAKLEKLGAGSALLFAQKDDAWLSQHRLGKAYRDIWLELNGQYIKTLDPEGGGVPASLMVTRTFRPPSVSRAFIFSQLSKNVEHACEKARHHGVRAKGLSFYLKTQEFTYHAVSLDLLMPIATPDEVLKIVAQHLDQIYVPGVLYRASGITLRSLISERALMADLFGEAAQTEKKSQVFTAVDGLNKRYGKQTVFLGSSLNALEYASGYASAASHKKSKSRARLSLGVDQKYKTLRMPYLGLVH
jgi:DNA polymerase-4